MEKDALLHRMLGDFATRTSYLCSLVRQGKILSRGECHPKLSCRQLKKRDQEVDTMCELVITCVILSGALLSVR